MLVMRLGGRVHMASVELIEGLVKVAAGKDGAVQIEAVEINVSNVVDHFAVLGKPDVHRIGEVRDDSSNVRGVSKCVGAATDGDGDPVSRVAGDSGFVEGAVATRGETRGTDGEVFLVDRANDRDNVGRDTKVLCEGAGVGQVV